MSPAAHSAIHSEKNAATYCRGAVDDEEEAEEEPQTVPKTAKLPTNATSATRSGSVLSSGCANALRDPNAAPSSLKANSARSTASASPSTYHTAVESTACDTSYMPRNALSSSYRAKTLAPKPTTRTAPSAAQATKSRRLPTMQRLVWAKLPA